VNQSNEEELTRLGASVTLPVGHITDMISTVNTCSDSKQVNEPDEIELAELIKSVVMPVGHITDMISTVNTCSDSKQVNELEGSTELSESFVLRDNNHIFQNATRDRQSTGHFLKQKLDNQSSRLLVRRLDCVITSSSSSSMHDDSDRDCDWNPLEQTDDVSSGSYSDNSKDVEHFDDVSIVENSVDENDMSMQIPVYASIQLKAAPSGVHDPTSSTHMLKQMEKVRAGRKLKTFTASKTTSPTPEDPFTFHSMTSATSFAGLISSKPSSEFPTDVQSAQDEAAGPSKSCK
jgi:hypothetical protein